jgi:N-acetylglucosamine transport system substrate-binding protein
MYMPSDPQHFALMSRRALLQRAALAGLIVSPAAGLLAACAGSPTDNSSTTGAKSPDNPFGVADGSKVDVVVFNGGLGDEYPKFDNTLFAAKHGRSRSTSAPRRRSRRTAAPVQHHAGRSDQQLGRRLDGTGRAHQRRALTDLGPLLDAPSWDDPNKKVRDTLLPGTVDDGTFNGKFYVLNYAYTVFGIWYNKALFDKNGWAPPTTFDEFFTLAPKIKAAGIAPFAFAGKYPYYMRWAIMSWIWKSGGRQAVVDIDNLKAGAWKAAPVMAALNATEKLVKDGLTLTGSATLSHTESQQAWLDGKAAFLPVGTWLENEMKATIPADFKMSISNFWGVSSADKAAKAVFAGSGEGWIVPKKAANAAGGMEFLRAMLSRDGAAKFASLTHSLASTAGSGDKVTDSTALTSANSLMKGAGELVSFKFPDWYGDLDKANQNAIGELMAGRMTAAAFADTMQAAADKIAADSSVKKQTRT